ncbi:MAG: PAS domain-containing sensor histidine kinase [Cellulosilyticaceae bacterium]
MLDEACLKSRILDTIPGTYFYGRIIHAEEGLDLEVLQSNGAKALWQGQCVSRMACLNTVQILWDACLQETLTKGTYHNTQLRISRLSSDECVIWIDSVVQMELLEAKDALETQQYLLELFIDAIPDVVFYKDPQGVYITCNKALEQLIGQEKKAIIGRKDSEVAILQTQSHLCETFDQKVVASKTGITVEEKVFLPTGEVRIMESMKAPFWGPQEDLLGIIGICRDVTERRRAEELLAQSEYRFRKVFENISEGMVMTHAGSILEVNEAYEKIYGEGRHRIPKEAGIQYILDKFDPESLEEALPSDITAPFAVNGRIIRCDGDERYIGMKHEIIGGRRGVILISDITAQIQKDRELEHLRQEFFANLSHEFKTPINLIHSALQLMKLRLQDEQIEMTSYDKCFSICNQNISRLLKLISNLIDSTKIDAGYFKYNPKNYDIVQVVESIVMSVVTHCEQNGLAIIFDTEVEEKVVAFDLELMERMVLNLLSNAIKYSKGQLILVYLRCEDGNIKIEVNDDGIGIPGERLENIFEKFTQINNRFTKVGEGSGLGLYLVKSFAAMHNGTVLVESELGIGTRFTVCIPDVQAPDGDVSQLLLDKIEYVERTKFEFSDL